MRISLITVESKTNNCGLRPEKIPTNDEVGRNFLQDIEFNIVDSKIVPNKMLYNYTTYLLINFIDFLDEINPL